MAVGNIRVIGQKGTDTQAVFDDLAIRSDDVFAKTQTGVEEARSVGGSSIPPKLRTVLMLIDGRTPFESFKSTLKTYGDVTELFSILRDLGLIIKTSRNDYARERSRVSAPSASSPLGGDTQSSRGNSPSQNFAPLESFTQTPAMSARISRSEQAPEPYAASPVRPARPTNSDVEVIKSNMVRDVSAVLGADAGPVIAKIQGCQTRDDLFASMMGIKKIISIYADRAAADKFASRYQSLSQ
jgi:hypothetical protein